METNNQLRENSCECVQEIVKKGMDPVAKLSLLNKLNIFQVLNKVSLVNTIFPPKFFCNQLCRRMT